MKVMKIDFITYIIKQLVCWILLLQMINISIDPRDIKLPKDTSVIHVTDGSADEIESVYELVAEGVFNKEVPPDNEDEIDTSSPSLELYFFTPACIELPAIAFVLKHFSYCYNHFTSVHQEPLFQPPK